MANNGSYGSEPVEENKAELPDLSKVTDLSSGMAAVGGLFSYGWGATKSVATATSAIVSEKMVETGASTALESTKAMMAPVLDKTVEVANAAKDGVVSTTSDIAENGTQAEFV
jgi:hypothetical protein